MDQINSNQNISFKTIYVVIRAGLIMVHHRDPRPIDLNQVPYVLIIVSPSLTGSIINNISGIYVYGVGSGDYVQYQIENLNLLQLLPGTGSTVIEKLQHHYLSLSGETQKEILHPAEPELNGLFHQQSTTSGVSLNSSHYDVRLSYPGSTDFESFITSFMAGIGSHLAIFDILKYQRTTIGDPFYPMHIRPPLDNDRPENLLTQGIGEYLGYHARTLQGISRGEKSITRVGPTWLSMIDCFWKGYATCFNKGPLNNPSVAIHDTMIGYCCHQDNKIQILESRFREISIQTNNYLNSIQNQGSTILDQMKMTSRTAQEELSQLAIKTEELITKTFQEFEEKIKVLSAKSIQNTQEERQSTISSITALRSDAQKSIRQWADEGVDQIQTVYSKGFDEISSVKAESLNNIRLESQRGLDLISADQDRAISNLANVQRGVTKDLAELHNEGVEKNLLMIEDGKKDFFRFNTAIVENIQNMADNNVSEIGSIKDQIIESNQFTLNEIDIKVKQANQNLQDTITIGLTNMLDQQSHLTNGVRIDAKNVALEKLRESMDQAVQETLERLGVGIDQIVKVSLQTQLDTHLKDLNQEISRAVEISVGAETAASKVLAKNEITQDRLESAIRRIEKLTGMNSDYDHPRPDQTLDQLDFQSGVDCQIVPGDQSNEFVKLISYPQELAGNNFS